ncbi:hypothetical protein FQA39_LY00258 [Lamprigera yunnana]|nr:hypothetical protein FQA39_LY00258 [Lamprigera yunnana]
MRLSFVEYGGRVSLVVSRKDIIECKKTDVSSSRAKEEEWKNLAHEFNSNCNNGTLRDCRTLRRKYENIKKRSKKAFAEEKLFQRGTGGGPKIPSKITNLEEIVKDMLGSQVTGLPTEFGGDSQDIVFEVVPDEGEEDYKMSNDTQPSTSQEVYKDWSKYTPSMLRQPQSNNLTHSAIELKILEDTGSSSKSPKSNRLPKISLAAAEVTTTIPKIFTKFLNNININIEGEFAYFSPENQTSNFVNIARGIHPEFVPSANPRPQYIPQEVPNVGEMYNAMNIEGNNDNNFTGWGFNTINAHTRAQSGSPIVDQDVTNRGSWPQRYRNLPQGTFRRPLSDIFTVLKSKQSIQAQSFLYMIQNLDALSKQDQLAIIAAHQISPTQWKRALSLETKISLYYLGVDIPDEINQVPAILPHVDQIPVDETTYYIFSRPTYYANGFIPIQRNLPDWAIPPVHVQQQHQEE